MAHPPNIFPTGVPHLDTVLGGGIVRTSMVLIVGASGTGKTILGSQIAAATARMDEPVVLVTAFGESHNKRIANLKRFSFFDRRHVGEHIRLINMEHQLRTGLQDAAGTIIREARDHQARLVVLDSLLGVRMCGGTPTAVYSFLHELGAKLQLLGVTTLILGERGTHLPLLFGESTLADTVIELHPASAAAQRTLQVHKHQGMLPLPGTHTFMIDHGGVYCYARFELMPPPAAVAPAAARMSTGLPQLDQMLGGGMPHDSITLITGATGTGKTTLALQSAQHGAAHGTPTLFVTIGAPAQHLVAHGQARGSAAHMLHTPLQIEEYALAELDPDIVAHRVWAYVAAHSGSHIILDGAQHLLDVLGDERGPGFWQAVFAQLRAHHATTWLLHDDGWTAERAPKRSTALRTLADNLVDLYRTADTPGGYMLDVAKMRSSDHARVPQPYSIGVHGIGLQVMQQATTQG